MDVGGASRRNLASECSSVSGDHSPPKTPDFTPRSLSPIESSSSEDSSTTEYPSDSAPHNRRDRQASYPLRNNTLSRVNAAQEVTSDSHPPLIQKREGCRLSDNECSSVNQFRFSAFNHDDMKWQNFAKEVKESGGATYYECLWKRNGRQCEYWAQKQAMKRHIEATHFKLKPHKCSYCPNAYSQKTALEVHEATHTGVKAHACYYKCGKTFSDPARRYRHHVNNHGYVPRQSNKKFRDAQTHIVRSKERP